MIRNTLLATTLLILGTLAIAPKTMAQTAPQSMMPQTVDVPFSGQVTGICNVGEITPGTLVPTGSTTGPIALSSGAPFSPNGTPGKVVVTCNSPASIAVSRPVQTGGPAFSPMKSDATVRLPGGPIAGAMGGTPLRLSPSPNAIPLEVGMIVDKGSPLAPGNYNYKVTLTIAP
ncbi:hypothetical protein RIVM261_060550 [Rivularia sp. IAM M-261]|nr:hypothetical protein RIVM261_060550 [Rivularia sp. IAM M-261]